MTVLYAHCGADGKAEAPALLALALAREYGITPPARSTGEGKPYFPARPEICFNLSHSGGWALCAVGDTPVGVDIEQVRPRRAALPARLLAAEEYAWFRARGAQWADFTALWTLKESFCKCTGQGLDRAPRLLRVPCLSPGTCGSLGGFFFRAFGGADWRAAACVPSTGALARALLWV